MNTNDKYRQHDVDPHREGADSEEIVSRLAQEGFLEKVAFELSPKYG